MILPKPLKKFVAVFRGDVAPILILLSAMMGFWFGLTPGWYGIHLALLLIALIVNIHIGIFLMFGGLGKAVSFAAAPLLFHTGVWAQDGATGLLAFISGIPIVGVTDFSRYAVAGALLIGPTIGLLLGLLLAGSVGGFRRAMLRADETSETFRRWRQKRWIRFLDWLLIGKSAQDVKAVLKRRARIVRLPGVALAVILLVASAVGLHVVQESALAEYAAKSLSDGNGAEVNLESVELSATEGRLTCTGIQITDPEKPTHNRVAIGKLTADVSLWNLSRGRVVMDEIELSGVQLDSPRKSPGFVSKPPAEDDVEDSPFDPIDFQLPIGDLNALESYVENKEQIREWLETVREWLPDKQAAPGDVPQPQSYPEFLTFRAPGSPTPRLLIRRLVLDDVEVPLEQVGTSRIVCTNLSDAPQGAGLPVTIVVTSNEKKASLEIKCEYDAPEPAAAIAATFEDVDLRELQGRLNRSNPILFEGGVATARINGKVSRDIIDFSIGVKTKGMKARSTGAGAFGLDSEVTGEAMKLLENFETKLRLVGPLNEPRLVFDETALSEEMKKALVRAG